MKEVNQSVKDGKIIKTKVNNKIEEEQKVPQENVEGRGEKGGQGNE